MHDDPLTWGLNFWRPWLAAAVLAGGACGAIEVTSTAPDAAAPTPPSAGECTSANDCSGPLLACHTWSCELGACLATSVAAGTSCDDGDGCSETDTCSVGGACSGAPRVCDDANPCTSDACQASQCVFSPLDGLACDDGKACTGSDHCANSVCLGTPTACTAPPAAKCEDGVQTVYAAVGTCNPDDGQCGYGPVETACAGACAGAVCAGAADPCQGVVCTSSDANPCKESEGTCVAGVDGAAATCQYEDLDGGACEDDNPCTVGDACAKGECVAGTTRECSTPPADYCLAPAKAVDYQATGFCNANASLSDPCEYPSQEKVCPAGCDAGVCLGALTLVGATFTSGGASALTGSGYELECVLSPLGEGLQLESQTFALSIGLEP